MHKLPLKLPAQITSKTLHKVPLPLPAQITSTTTCINYLYNCMHKLPLYRCIHLLPLPLSTKITPTAACQNYLYEILVLDGNSTRYIPSLLSQLDHYKMLC